MKSLKFINCTNINWKLICSSTSQYSFWIITSRRSISIFPMRINILWPLFICIYFLISSHIKLAIKFILCRPLYFFDHLSINCDLFLTYQVFECNCKPFHSDVRAVINSNWMNISSFYFYFFSYFKIHFYLYSMIFLLNQLILFLFMMKLNL